MGTLAVTALLIGLAGGVHCVVMCGGIIAALNLRTSPSAAAAGSVTRQIAYSAGRLASYTAAGALAGGAGGLTMLFSRVLPVQILLLVAANALIILLGLHLAGLGRAVLVMERAGGFFWRGLSRLGARISPASSHGHAIATGILWGFLPCGLVYSVLATALLAGSAARGAAVMAAFGLGTLPNLLAAGMAAGSLQRFARRPMLRRAAGLAVMALGVLGLARVPQIADHVRHGLHMLH